MTVRHRVAALTGLLCALGAGTALAADLVPVKIGVLNDRSGVYFDSPARARWSPPAWRSRISSRSRTG